MDLEGPVTALSRRMAFAPSGFWFGVMVVGRSAGVLGASPQGRMAEGLLQLGQLRLVVLDGGFTTCFGGIDEVV